MKIIEIVNNSSLSGELAYKIGYLEAIVQNECLVLALLKIVKFRLQNDKKIGDWLFSDTEIPKLDSPLNTAKSNALECFNTILEMTKRHESIHLLNPQFNKFVMVNENELFMSVFQSLIGFSRRYYFEIEKRKSV